MPSWLACMLCSSHRRTVECCRLGQDGITCSGNVVSWPARMLWSSHARSSGYQYLGQHRQYRHRGSCHPVLGQPGLAGLVVECSKHHLESQWLIIKVFLINYGLLWGIVANHFRPLGFLGRCSYLTLAAHIRMRSSVQSCPPYVYQVPVL